MKVILDTNVFVSGVFFSGPPHLILKAWRDRKIGIVISPEILGEYQRVGEILSKQFPGIDLDPFIDLVTTESDFVVASQLTEGVCEDPDDDKFIATAIASDTKVIISGDKHLLRVSGYRGIQIIKPRIFVEEILE